MILKICQPSSCSSSRGRTWGQLQAWWVGTRKPCICICICVCVCICICSYIWEEMRTVAGVVGWKRKVVISIFYFHCHHHHDHYHHHQLLTKWLCSQLKSWSILAVHKFTHKLWVRFWSSHVRCAHRNRAIYKIAPSAMLMSITMHSFSVLLGFIGWRLFLGCGQSSMTGRHCAQNKGRLRWWSVSEPVLPHVCWSAAFKL